MALAVALGWVAGLAFIGQAWCLSRIVHAVFIEGRSRESLWGAFAGFAAAVLLRAAAAGLREASAFSAGKKTRAAVRLRLLERILAGGPAFTGGERTGGLASTLIEQVEGLHDFYALYLPQTALVALVPLTVAAAVLPISWAAAGLLLATAPLIPLFTVLVGMGAENVSQRHFTALARLSAHFLDVLQGLATLKLFGRSRDEAARIARLSADFRRRTMSVLRIAFISSAVLEFFTSLAIALVAVYLGMSHLGYFAFGTYGRPLSLADGLFILVLAPEFFLPLRELGAHYHSRAQALAAAERIRGLLDAPAPGSSRGSRLAVARGGIRIECRDLALSYTGRPTPALRGVSLDLAPGSFTLLVGGSGAGKSSLISLLLGFQRPQKGGIRVNGVPLEELDPDGWRRQVGWLGQSPAIFYGSLRENLSLGRPAAGEDEILAAARAAGVLAFAGRMPLGLDTPVGEQGVGLSRGEAQRVALARVFLKDAPVVLLDEPFSGLDPESENWVREAIESLRPGRTVLAVDHRLSDYRRAGQIVVLEAGRMVAAGPPEAIEAIGGPFEMLRRPPPEGGSL
jgi:ATP-binding cassette subfamily C protein CydD